MCFFRGAVLRIAAAVILCLLFCGCAAETITYTSEYARVKNLCGSGWLTDGDLAVTSLNGCTYRFDPGIPEAERAEYIRIHQEILGILPSYSLDGNGLEWYVLQNIVSHADSGCTAYADLAMQKNTEQVLLILRAICGEYTNYGYLYALAADAAATLGWCEKEAVLPDVSIFRENPDLLNLVYPCFTEPYADEKQQKACRDLAVYLYDTAETAICNEMDFRKAVLAFAEENNLAFIPTRLEFSHGTSDCPLKIRTSWLQIYLDSEYEGSCTLSEESMAADPLFHLTPMIGFLESVDDRLTELRELFACTDTALLPVYMQPVHQIFSATGKNYGGMYYPCGGNSYVEASSIYVLTHEYVHYLDDLTGTGDDSWCGEVLAVYYQKDMTYLSRCVSAGFGASITIEWLTEIIGQPYDSVEDEILFQHIMTAHEENPRYSLISLYNGRLSFGDYFIQTYGEPVFIDCMLQPEKTILHTGFTMDEIVEQWCGWLEQFKF